MPLLQEFSLLASPTHSALRPLFWPHSLLILNKSSNSADKALRMAKIYTPRKLSNKTSISLFIVTMNSRNNTMRCYVLSLQTILLLASTPFGLCDSVKKPHGLVLHNHLQLQLTEAKNPVNNPPNCINPPPPSLGAVPLPFSSTPPLLPSPSTQTPPYYAPKPPAIIPPPMTHPSPPIPPYKKPENAVWCVAKPTVPEVLLQQAMDYACGSGAGCEAIEQNGVCFQPNTVLSHASYAFNSYWQKTKQAGGTCEFGGVAMLVTVDPSYDECHFVYF